MRTFARILTAAAIAVTGLVSTQQAEAGDCTGRVVGVRSLAFYNHATGAGFLAVRRGPGSKSRQIGEVYAGDLVSVYDRSGNWYHITCMEGDCENPLWGPRYPSGWVSSRYVSAGGVCP